MSLVTTELTGSFRERLNQLGSDLSRFVHEPLSDDEIEGFRAHFAPRHLSEELVEFWRVGPVTPVGVHRAPTKLFEADNDDRYVSRMREGRVHALGPMSSRWVELGSKGEEMVLCPTLPRPGRVGGVVVWDVGGPGRLNPMFPSLGSLLWYWNAVAGEMLSGSIGFDPTFKSWFRCLVDTSDVDSDVHVDLHRQAVALVDEHDGWVWDQPTPFESGWTEEWVVALGVGDLDMTV